MTSYYMAAPSSRLKRVAATGSEHDLIEALRDVPREKTSRARRESDVIEILETTNSAAVRNEAALALVDMGSKHAASVILKKLTDGTLSGPHRGTLIYALSESKSAIPLLKIIELFPSSSFEARAEILNLLGNSNHQYSERDLEAAKRILRTDDKGPRERAAQARQALELLPSE